MGIEPPPGLEGTSLKAILDNPGASVKAAAYSYQKNRISMRTQRYRLIVHVEKETSTFALFDHQVDPYETRNIAGENPEIVRRLMPLLKKGNTGIIQDFWGDW
jgi:hypothetical protein